MPATTGETSEPQHIEDAYSGKKCFSGCIYVLLLLVISSLRYWN